MICAADCHGHHSIQIASYDTILLWIDWTRPQTPNEEWCEMWIDDQTAKLELCNWDSIIDIEWLNIRSKRTDWCRLHWILNENWRWWWEQEKREYKKKLTEKIPKYPTIMPINNNPPFVVFSFGGRSSARAYNSSLSRCSLYSLQSNDKNTPYFASYRILCISSIQNQLLISSTVFVVTHSKSVFIS